MKKLFYHSDERVQQINIYHFGVIGLISLCISFCDVMIRGLILGYSFSHWCVSLVICIIASVYYLLGTINRNVHYPPEKKRTYYLYFFIVFFIVSVYIFKDFRSNNMGVKELSLKFVFLFIMDYFTLLFFDKLLRKFKTK